MKLDYDGSKLCYDGSKLCLCDAAGMCECTNCESGTCLPDTLELTLSGLSYDNGIEDVMTGQINDTFTLDRVSACVWADNFVLPSSDPTITQYNWGVSFTVFRHVGGFIDPKWEYHGAMANGIYFLAELVINQVNTFAANVTENALFRELMGPVPTVDCISNLPNDVTYYGVVRTTFSPSLSDAEFLSASSPVGTVAIP